MTPSTAAETDPVLRRRRRIDTAARWAKRFGWMFFGIATVAFFVGVFTRFEPWLVQVIVAGLVVGSLLLAPAIVFSFAVAATEREERGEGYGH